MDYGYGKRGRRNGWQQHQVMGPPPSPQLGQPDGQRYKPYWKPSNHPPWARGQAQGNGLGDSDNNNGHRQNKFRGRGGRGKGRGRGGGGNGDNMFNANRFVMSVPEKQHNYYCCSCERGFKSMEELDAHNEEHIVCGLDGCQFEAHALVVTKHVRIQHTGNLYQRMKNLNTPEDIERWRQDRKKNYPSGNKVLEKEKEEMEMVERREICGRSKNAKRFPCSAPSNNGKGPLFRYRIRPDNPVSRMYMEMERRLKKMEQDQGDNWMRRMFAPDMRNRDKRVPFFSLNKSKLVHLESFYLNVKQDKEGKLKKRTKVKYKGLRAKQMERLADSESEAEDAHIPISDEEEGDEKTEQMPDNEDKGSLEKVENESVNKSIGGLLLVDYSSASGSEDEGSERKEDKADLNVNPDAQGSQNIQNSSSLSIERNSKLEVNFVIDEFSKDSAFRDKPIFLKPLRYRRQKGWTAQNRLLETLLHDQIRKERNILLQACRFVCKNNFFEKDNKSNA